MTAFSLIVRRQFPTMLKTEQARHRATLHDKCIGEPNCRYERNYESKCRDKRYKRSKTYLHSCEDTFVKKGYCGECTNNPYSIDNQIRDLRIARSRNLRNFRDKSNRHRNASGHEVRTDSAAILVHDQINQHGYRCEPRAMQ